MMGVHKLSRAAAAGRCALDRRGVSAVEFALALPMMLGLSLGAIEAAQFIRTVSAAQTLATSMANMVAQSGIGGVPTTQADVYDMFDALNVAARPFDVRKDGRVVISVLQGTQVNTSTVENRFAPGDYAQQFDGAYLTIAPVIGCRLRVVKPNFYRKLRVGELMAHVQVTLRYRPVFSATALSYFDAPTSLTRTAVYRMRKNGFNILPDSRFPAKKNCDTTTGL